jgi:chemotaxis protein histidine kinase CheA/CheY-like chemotaxis protein
MKEFASMARTCRGRLMATVDRLRDLKLEQDAGRGKNGRRPSFDRGTDVPELIRRLVEQSDDLVVLAESAQALAKPLADNSDALARLTLQLWESLQAIRIVPVRGLFQRLMRVAHDAARVEGRQVEVTTIGEETGLDRAVQDKAFEPLLHVVRNAVCHGIEPPADRSRSGKPPAGRVTLEAARTGNTLVLSVRDDGRGLDYEAIAAKGRRLGLIGPDDRPGPERLNALIFQSGFSTRDAANSVAGRGVGMDVVSQEVARLHGTVALSSQHGRGTKLSLSLPARLALERAMVLRVDGQAYALPVELIELAQPFDQGEIDWSGACPKVRMRDEWVPLIAAREALGLPPSATRSCSKLLWVRADGARLALLVDSIDGTRELVIKPLGPLLTGHPIVSGTSLSVTGEAVFALNPSGLARWWREGFGDGGVAAGLTAPPRSAPILVVDDSISVRTLVARQLRALGYEVEEVSDGLEALGKVRGHGYSLVISDLEMPRMDGFELLAELNRLEIAPALPVIVASSRCDDETRRRVLGLKARAFLNKPIEPDVLADLVRSLSLKPEVATAAG